MALGWPWLGQGWQDGGGYHLTMCFVSFPAHVSAEERSEVVEHQESGI